MTSTIRNLYRLAALATCSAVALGGCTSLLGDFSYDPNPNDNSRGGGISAEQQGNIVVLPTAGLVTTEQGAKAAFTITLKVKPMAPVAIALSSSDDTEGTVNPVTVSFTPENFDAPQMVQITGVDDSEEDKNQNYTIRTSPSTSEDPLYHGIDPVDPSVMNVDDDTAGFLVTPIAGLVTSESGAEATFTVVLNHAPTADVSIGLTSDKPTEGTVSPAMLTFNPVNWMAPQTVTVTGVNDDLTDKAQIYHVVTGVASSTDTAYDKLDPDDVEVTNQDNDTAGITLTPSDGLITFESGAMTTFGIALNAPPTSDVSIALTSNDENEGTVTPASVTFTTVNWMAPQVITVTGVDDDRADGNQPYLIQTGAAASDDTNYSGLDGPDAAVINIDNDSPGLNVMPMGLTTGENGDATTFTVALNSKPQGAVVLDVTSSRTQEGIVTPAQLAFDEVNWNAPQVVTVTGVDDLMADGTQTYVVHVKPNAGTADAAYLALLESDVNLSNIDNDSAGILVAPQTGLTTFEDGRSATFTVVLNSQPTADVTIPLTSTDTSEGTITPTQLVFTKDNYAAPQMVTIKGVDDAMADGNQPFKVNTEQTVSTDPNYAAINAANVDVSNTDNDSPGIIVTPAGQILTTTEAGGSAMFTVVLQSQPTADVDIGISSSNTAEGTVSPASLKFTLANWNAPQQITVKGVNDDFADGPQQYRVAIAAAVSTDPNYSGRDALDVTVSNTDNDSAGITLQNATNLITTEVGGTASFKIVLNSRPTANVSLNLSSSKTAEGTVSPAAVTFTNANWSAPQTVTITGVDDKVADGPQPYRVVIAAATSQDPKYNGMDATDPNVSNTDNDSAGITVTAAANLATSEAGGTATFTVVLNSQPTADVTIPLHSSKTSEGTISPSSLTFTAANYAAPRSITITGVDDAVADGPQPYSVVIDAATSGDAGYNGRDPADVSVSNVDNDSAGITVSAVTGDTNENGTTASFTIVLNSQPKADVSIALTSSNTKEGTISPASVNFTAANWNAPQKITITGVDDSVADGPQPYDVDTAPAVSGDAGYSGRDANDVSLSNIDNDSAGFTVSAAKGNTTEAGVTTTFTIKLNSQPTADVTIPLSSSDTAEGTISTSSVTFTSTDWSSAKTITITGVNDDFADGTQPYSIVLAAVTSTDKGYSGLNPPDVSLSNVDDDSAGITVTTVTSSTSEDLGTASFKVALNSRPTANVVIPISSNDEGEGVTSPTSLTFTTNNWSSAQTVTITGVNDDFADGTQVYKALVGAASSTDTDYEGLDGDDVSLSNVDNDSASIDVTPVLGDTSEAGTTTTFTIRLNSKPTANVTIPVSSSDDNEGSLSITSVSFTTDNWSSAQTVTVHGEDDKVADGPQDYKILLGAATSGDADYNTMNADDVDVTNLDNDTAGIEVSVASGPTSEAGTSATFTIVLNSQPTAAVSIPIASSDTAEGMLSEATVDFTTSNWASPHTVTVTGVDDALADGDKAYSIVVGNPTSTDTKYAAIDPDDVALINTDDDSAGINVSPAGGDISETGTSTTFEIKLNSQPSANVVIPLSVSDTTEGSLQITSITITSGNWKMAKKVTVTGVDDNVKDGPQNFKVMTGNITSGDTGYNGKNPPDVSVTNLDDDSAFVSVIQPTMTQTGEAAGSPTVTFTVRLTSAPSAAVTIPLLSTQPGEGLITSPASGELVFDDTNWDQEQTVVVQGQDDLSVDGDAMYAIEIGPAVSADSNYDGFDPNDVTGLLNIDDDVL